MTVQQKITNLKQHYSISFLYFSKKLQTVPNAFIVHLAGIDTIICGVILPLTMQTYVTDKYGGPSACKVLGPLNVMVMVLSLLSLTNVAVNRYIMVCKPPHVSPHVRDLHPTLDDFFLYELSCKLQVSLWFACTIRAWGNITPVIIPVLYGLSSNIRDLAIGPSRLIWNSILHKQSRAKMILVEDQNDGMIHDNVLLFE